jgi:hypothetical protein
MMKGFAMTAMRASSSCLATSARKEIVRHVCYRALEETVMNTHTILNTPATSTATTFLKL